MVTLEMYRERRRRPAAHEKLRLLCVRCLQPHITCYCEHIQSFDPKIKFVILIHPLEVRRRIATGRMSHLVLRDSQLIHGYDFTANPAVDTILKDPAYDPVILYPGRNSTNLSPLTLEQRVALFTPKRQPVIFVVDGTWSTARKMLRRSPNLLKLPQICFTPNRPSNFRVRQQPKRECLSTIEAIHHTLELIGPVYGFDPADGEQNKLLHVFDKMVEQQLEFIRQSRLARPFSRHNRRRKA